VITVRDGPEDRTIDPEAFVHESGPAPGGGAGFACFSPDRRYRWSLRRAWPGNGPAMTFVMLNPSTAGATQDDATIRRCRGFAEREGCASFEVVNLFALVSTSPAALLSDPDPVGAASDQFIAACTGRDNRTVVVASGANADRPRLLTRANQVLDLLDEHEVAYRALGITAGRRPAHPLHLRKDTPLQRGLRRRAGRRDHGGRKSGMSIYEREGETYRALQINGPDDGPAGADYIVRRDSDACFGGYIVDTAKDGQAHPADPGPDPDAGDLPYRFEAYDDAGRYVASGQSLRGAVSVFSHQGRVRWIQDRQPDREAGS
jgi:hypothetical protein